MLTLLVRVLLLAELAGYIVLGSWLWALAIALGARLALVLLTSLHGWLHRSPRRPEHRLGLAATIRLLASEYVALLADNFVYLPFERQILRPDPAPSPGSRAPVILVHGYLSNRGYFRPMVRWLEARGVTNVFVPDYRSIFSTIESGVATLRAEVERICAGTGQRVVLVCHSMGGLVARRYLQDHGEERIARLVTIASPHHGSELARIGIGTHARQMERASAFLEALARAEAAKPPAVPTLSIYTVHDNLVSPQDTSRLEWARNAAIAGVAHVGILASPEAFERVLEELKAAGAA
jgi:triacylglycerol esterase/lipase EstA (alpha/beta hydrolase family)